MSGPAPPAHKIRVWPADNRAQAPRVADELVRSRHGLTGCPNCKRGRQRGYSEAPIRTCLTMKVLFGMALRQSTGFVESLRRLVGLDWAVPDFSTLSRRQKTLRVSAPYRGSDDTLHLRVDSTGIKVEGDGKCTEEGQQTVQATVCPAMAQAWGHQTQDLAQYPRGIDPKTPEIRAEFTTSNIGYALKLPELVDQIPLEQEIATHTAEGAFNTRKCHDAIAARGAAAIIPPRKNAKQWKRDIVGAVAPKKIPSTSKRVGRAI